MSAHRCHALRCNTPCTPSMLMCLNHWGMVPVDLRKAVVKNYRRGQCADRRPSREWLTAARAAITAVGKQEGHLK